MAHHPDPRGGQAHSCRLAPASPPSWPAGTAHNRRMFMSIARRCLQPMAAAGPLTIEDYHNVLQLLCADCPGSMVKNAWSAATAVHAKATGARAVGTQKHAFSGRRLAGSCESCGRRRWLWPCAAPLAPAGTVQSIEDGSEQLVSVDALMHCLEITFLFEQYLMALRRGAFGADKTCECAATPCTARGPPSGLPLAITGHYRLCVSCRHQHGSPAGQHGSSCCAAAARGLAGPALSRHGARHHHCIRWGAAAVLPVQGPGHRPVS